MSPTAANILVVDDDQRLRDLLNRYLGEQGFGVQAVASAPDMDNVMGKKSVDMIILDLMLPGEDGMSICRRLRAAGRRTPIIMLTAKGDEADRIAGLDVGADDYLPKPFNPRELVARINAVLRRQAPVVTSPGAPDDTHQPVKFGAFEINLAAGPRRRRIGSPRRTARRRSPGCLNAVSAAASCEVSRSAYHPAPAPSASMRIPRPAMQWASSRPAAARIAPS